MHPDDFTQLEKIGEKEGYTPHTIDLVKAAWVAVTSGDVSLPFSQDEAEITFCCDLGVQPVVELLMRYPDFIACAKSYYLTTGGTIR
jgi:thiazole synthase ThiGH ThiG subunit